MSAQAQCSIYSCSKLTKASLNANLLYNLNLPILPSFTPWIKSLVFDHSTESYGGSIFTRRRGSHIGVPKHRNGDHIGVQTILVGVELASFVNAFFCSHKFAWLLATRVKTLYTFGAVLLVLRLHKKLKLITGIC